MTDDPDNNLGRRVASLETDMRSMREEVQLNRRRYHELATSVAPLVLETTDISRHEIELRSMRSAIDHMRGVWTSISIMAVVLSAVIIAMWTLFTHLKLV